MRERLQKILSAHGIASRRAAEEYLRQGRVFVNGQPARLGDSADAETDKIALDGQPLVQKPARQVVMLYKPRGVVTTLSDEKGRQTVRDLLPGDLGRLVPVGRLDCDSEGLLLLTNDGALVQRITHPSFGCRKEYRVKVKGDVEAALPLLTTTLRIEGQRMRALHVRIVKKTEAGGVLSLTLGEGRNRQVRRMCEHVGLEVVLLTRTKIGELGLQDLKPGDWCILTEKELEKVWTPHMPS